MSIVLLVTFLALAGALVGLRLAARARDEASRLKSHSAELEARVAERTQDLRLALDTADRQAKALAAANQAKTDFLAGMSHELRTPLNAVIGFSELMRMNTVAEPLTHRQGQAVDHVLAQGRHLLSLIDEVLDLAQIESGKMSVSMERVDPLLVARQVCDTLKPDALAAGVTLHEPPATAGLGVGADRTRLRQILLNLLSNAIKYNRPDGAVLIEVRQAGDTVAIAVTDTGEGIPPERLAELFQPFNRLGREATEVPGTGIGLAVSRRLAETMNGRLEVFSREGEGCTFTLYLPVAKVSDTPVSASPLPSTGLPLIEGRAATLLYVEDNLSNIALMRHVIAALGTIQLHVAETGHEGLALARDLRPDVILLDINLPGLSGFELKAKLDADPLTQGLPVLALSASAMPQDIQRGREAGFRDYLTKPLEIGALARALNCALEAGERTRSAA